jgi:purine-binding chemotaxis protein CheW
MKTTKQFSTFYIGDQLFGIDVMDVQEIARPLPITPIHRSHAHIKGLINLRGQISTAISLREIMQSSTEDVSEKMTVVCRNEEHHLISLLVDRIGDVMEPDDNSFENPPITMDKRYRQFISGVYKVPNDLLTIIDIKKLFQEIELKGE